MPRGETKHLAKHQFKKGAPSANPIGGRAHNPVTKALARLTVDTYREVIELVLTGNLTKLKAMVEHPDTPAIQVGVAAAFMKAIKNGDYAVMERIAERIVGKIPDQLNVVTDNKVQTTVNYDPIKLREAMQKLSNDV